MNDFSSDKIKEYIKKNKAQSLEESKNYIDNVPLFLKKISENVLSDNEIITILNNNPELSMQKYQGLHALHYAILSDNEKTLSLFMRFAINQGLKEFPITDITSSSKYENNQSILKFAYKQNKINTFISLFEFGSFDSKSIQDIAVMCMVDVNSNFNSFFRKIYGHSMMDELNLSIFKQKRYAPLLIDIIKNNSGNISRLKKFGYDLFSENENGTLLHNIFTDSSIYKLDHSLAKPVASEYSNIQHKSVASLFFENILQHKDLNLISKNDNNTPLYLLLESYLNSDSSFEDYNLKSFYEIAINEKVLELTAHRNTSNSKVLKF